MSRALSPIVSIAKFTLIDEVRQKSFLVVFFICAVCVFFVRSCYRGDYAVNGQFLDPETVAMAVSKVTFHIIGAGMMLIAALLAMRVFSRDRNEGLQLCILSKPIARWQYVTGKIIGIWFLSISFMFILHGIVFLVTSLHLTAVMPEYLFASLLCSLNLLFVVLAVFLLSLLMPDIVAFLSVLAVGVVGFVTEGLAAIGQSQIAQAMMQQSGAHPQSGLTWWKVVYYLWPKVSGVQSSASLLFSGESFHGFGSVYPFINVLLYCLILGTFLFYRFKSQDIA